MQPPAEPGADPDVDPEALSPDAVADAIADDDPPEVRSATVDAAGHGARLDRVLVGLAPEFSRNHLQSLIASGDASIDGIASTAPARRLRAGQRVAIALRPTAETLAYRPEPLPLSVVFEDEHLLVIEKAAGMVVHPAPGNWSGTLLNALLARDPKSAALPRAGIVHRLDKDTSGLMVVGRTLAATTALVRAIAAREVGRRYLAIAHGRAPAAAFTVEAPVGRDPRQRTRMAVDAGGKPARTDVERIAEHGGLCALRCTLHTGRTHQIRVHLASRGLPLVADRLYGGAPALGIERQALHAAELRLDHPVSGQALAFVSTLPGDLAPAWAAIESAPADDSTGPATIRAH